MVGGQRGGPVQDGTHTNHQHAQTTTTSRAAARLQPFPSGCARRRAGRQAALGARSLLPLDADFLADDEGGGEAQPHEEVAPVRRAQGRAGQGAQSVPCVAAHARRCAGLLRCPCCAAVQGMGARPERRVATPQRIAHSPPPPLTPRPAPPCPAHQLKSSMFCAICSMMAWMVDACSVSSPIRNLICRVGGVGTQRQVGGGVSNRRWLALVQGRSPDECCAPPSPPLRAPPAPGCSHTPNLSAAGNACCPASQPASHPPTWLAMMSRAAPAR